MKIIPGQRRKNKLRINKPVAHPQERGARVYLGEIWKISRRHMHNKGVRVGWVVAADRTQRICKFEFLLAFLGERDGDQSRLSGWKYASLPLTSLAYPSRRLTAESLKCDLVLRHNMRER